MNPDPLFSPGSNPGDPELIQVLDIPEVRSLMKDFTRLTGMSTSILDLNGNVIEASGWQDICTKFHRVNETTARFCTESDICLAKNLRPGEYRTYKCKNGLWDVVTPLYVGGKHAGNIYSGQFFFNDETVDVPFFEKQAEAYGFDREEYLSALRRVPRYSREQVRTLMEFLVGLTSILSRLSHGNRELAKSMAGEIKEKEARVRSERQLSDIINFLPDATFVIDRTGTVIAWNRAIEEMTGVPAARMVGKGNYEYALPFYGERRPILIDLVLRPDEADKDYYHIIRKEGDLLIAETELVHPLNKIVHLWGKATPLCDESGAKTGAIESIRDITEWKTAERALQQSEDRYRTLFENGGSPLIIVDEDTTILQVNREFEKVSGFSREEIEHHMSWTEFIADPQDLETMKEYHRLRRLGPELAPVTYESRIRKRNGEIRNAIITVAMIPGTRQSLAAFVDITDRRQAEIALENAKAFAENLIETANAIIVGLDTEGRITIFNHAAEKATGYSRAELQGRTWFDTIVPRERFPYVHEEFNRLIAGGLPKVFENPIVTKGGDVRSITWQNNEIFEQGRVVGTISVGIDITDRKNAEEELRNLYAGLEQRVAERTADVKQAEEAYRRANGKLNLLSSITRHDILNQLMVLKGFLRLSEQRTEDALVREHIQKAGQAAGVIERHITFTRLYQDIGIKSPGWHDVRECAGKQAADLLPASVAFGSDTGRLEIYTDPLFEKVLYTHMDNSIRHGGNVTAIRLSFRRAGTGELVLVYEDNGTGIRSEDKERIFERGFGKNTGFGLFLAREILAITGITLQETGEAGRGARFEMIVPPGGFRFRDKGEKAV